MFNEQNNNNNNNSTILNIWNEMHSIYIEKNWEMKMKKKERKK